MGGMYGQAIARNEDEHGDQRIDLSLNLHSLVDSLSDGVLVLGGSGDIVFANRRAEWMLDRPTSELIGEPFEIPISSNDRTGYAELRVAVTEWGGHPASLIVLRDSTRRRQTERDLAYRSTHDPLTGLPNRYLFEDRLRQVLTRAERNPGAVGLFYCDLDHLKGINDQYGHRIGDLALIETGRRLLSVIRPSDTAAHLSGDEFVILCENVDASQAQSLADRLALVFKSPVRINDLELPISLSVGFALSVDPRVDPVSLLEEADRAMYEAKKRNRLFRDQ